MTIYARQVPYDLQQSPLQIPNFYEKVPVIIISNKYGHFDWESEYKNLFLRIKDVFDDLYYDYSNLGTQHSCYENLKELATDYFGDDIIFTTEKLEQFKKYLDNIRGHFPYNFEVEMLSILTGLNWKKTTIHGSVQGDWADIMYIEEQFDDVSIFECEFFNTGTEWVIHAEGLGSFAIYIHDWYSYDDIKKEIKSMLGLEEDEDVVLHVFDNYQQIAKYKTV